MNRRNFLKLITPAALVAPLIAEELIWTPKRTWFLPPRSVPVNGVAIDMAGLSSMDIEGIIKRALGKDIEKSFDKSMFDLMTHGTSIVSLNPDPPSILHVYAHEFYEQAWDGRQLVVEL
jgi:hypothetical protein